MFYLSITYYELELQQATRVYVSYWDVVKISSICLLLCPLMPKYDLSFTESVTKFQKGCSMAWNTTPSPRRFFFTNFATYPAPVFYPIFSSRNHHQNLKTLKNRKIETYLSTHNQKHHRDTNQKVSNFSDPQRLDLTSVEQCWFC